jgi:hypothetical protein
MNRCVYYTEGERPAKIPEDQEYDGLRYTVCGLYAPYMVDGGSYCGNHVKVAIGHRTNKVGRKL